MSRNPAMEHLYTRKAVDLKPCGAEIQGMKLTDPSIPGLSPRVSLLQPSYGYGEFLISPVLAPQHPDNAPRVELGKIVVSSKHCVGGVAQREVDLRGQKPPQSLQALAGEGELTKYVQVRINIIRRHIKVEFFPLQNRNETTDRITKPLRAFRSSLRQPNTDNDAQTTLDLYLVPDDPGFQDKIDMIKGILAVAQAPTHPAAALLYGPPDKMEVHRAALLADFESSVKKEIGQLERPEPRRTYFWDAADRGVCFARAEVGEHQLKLQHNKAVKEHHAICSPVGVNGTKVNGVYAEYMLYVNTDAPHLLPRQGESCGVQFHGVDYTGPQPSQPPSDEQKFKAIATVMTDLFYDGPSPLTPAAKKDPAFARNVYCALARFDAKESEHACERIRRMGATDFDQLRRTNKRLRQLYGNLVPAPVTKDGVTTWKHPKRVYHDNVIRAVRGQPDLLRLPTYDYAAAGNTPIFRARRVHLESALQGYASAAFIAYTPTHKVLVTRADGDGHDEVLEGGLFEFKLGHLLDPADPTFPQNVGVVTNRVKCSFIPQSPDANLISQLWAINQASGQALKTDNAKYLMDYFWPGQLQGVNNAAGFPALKMLTSAWQPKNELEGGVFRYFTGLDPHQQKVFARSNFAYGTLSIVGGPGTGKTHAVLVLVLAVLAVKRGRVAIVCGNEKQADYIAGRLRRMAETIVDKEDPDQNLADSSLRVDVIVEDDKGALDVIDEVLTMHVAARTAGGRRIREEAEHGEPTSLAARVEAMLCHRVAHRQFRQDLVARAHDLAVDQDFRRSCRSYVMKMMSGLLSEAHAIITTPAGLRVLRANVPNVLDDVGLLVYPQAADISETSLLMADEALAHPVRRRMRKLPTSDHVPSLVQVLTLAEVVGQESDYAIHLTARDSGQVGYIGDEATMVVGLSRARLATVTVFTSTGLTSKPRDRDLKALISRLSGDGCVWTPRLRTFDKYCPECGHSHKDPTLFTSCPQEARRRWLAPMRERLSADQEHATRGPIKRTAQVMAG